MHVRRMLMVLALPLVTGGVALAPGAHAISPTIAFDGSPGTGAPPPTLGGYAMTAFAADPAPSLSPVTSAPGPSGDVAFDQTVTHFSDASALTGGWGSNGYTGDAYASDQSHTDAVVMTLPAGTRAFYFYAMGNHCVTQNVTATAQDGATSGPVSVVTDCSGNQPHYFGFYSTAADDISTITVSNDSSTGDGNVVGEFAIATAGTATWPFDDVANPTADTSGNGNNLTLGAGATFVPSPFGHALSLTGAPGANAEDTAPAMLPTGGAARTLAAWVKPAATDPGGALISYGDGAGGGQEFILALTKVSGTTYLFTDGVNGANNLVLTAGQIPAAGVWSHVALVLDGSNGWTYYLNGVSTASGTFGVPINTAVPTDLRVGDRTDGGFGQPPFAGQIDNASIYAQALTGPQVAALATNHAPSCADPQSGATNEDTALNSSVVCTDADNAALTYSKVAGPSHGTATVNGNGTFTYTPAANYNGPDSFTFKANDGIVDSNTATYNVTVNAVPDTTNTAYTGQPQGTTAKPGKLNLAGTITSTDPACVAHRTLYFLLNKNPTVANSTIAYNLGSATTGAASGPSSGKWTGTATITALSIGNWLPGNYVITAQYQGDDFTAGGVHTQCGGSQGQHTLTIKKK